MSLKQCGKCGEMVDEAKAFCPGCSGAFVEEQVRPKDSEFELSGGTMQFGQTMYNQMLSDMGLNISEAGSRDDKAADKAPETLPAAAQPKSIERKSGLRGNLKWIIAGAAVLLFLLAVAVILILLILYTRYA